jgi:hypothetical protein
MLDLSSGGCQNSAMNAKVAPPRLPRSRQRFVRCVIVAAWAVFLAQVGGAHELVAKGDETTIIGNTMTNSYLGKSQKGVFVYALDGPPAIKAEFETIMAGYPDDGLDADTAERIQDEFTKRLKFNIKGEGADKLREQVEFGSRMLAITGVVEEIDGEKWITLGKYEPAEFKFPAEMLAPDKPFVMPARPPLELRVSDDLSLVCIWVAPGKFFMGSPYYQHIRWQEDPPHRVTLTQSYYIAEIPVTQEIYQAVMSVNPSEFKDPKFPVSGIYSPEMEQFCAALSEKTRRKVRLPTAAEWEYAARVGTSNPTFPEKHADQNNPGGDAYSGKPGPVKAKKPNAWGLYDLCCNSWELLSDGPVLDRESVVDPRHPPVIHSDRLPDHIGKGGQKYPISEIEYLHPGDGRIIRFRVVVEDEESPR